MILRNREIKRDYHNSRRTAIKKEHCIGCEDNFYNGNNPHGTKECWCFDSAYLTMKKKVHVDQVPPWTQKAIKVPNCYRVKRYVFVDADRTC